MLCKTLMKLLTNELQQLTQCSKLKVFLWYHKMLLPVYFFFGLCYCNEKLPCQVFRTMWTSMLLMRCQTVGELRMFPKGWHWDGRCRDNRSSRWGVPLALVLSARASCCSPGLPLGPVSSPESPKSTTIYIFLNISLFNELHVRIHLKQNLELVRKNIAVEQWK